MLLLSLLAVATLADVAAVAVNTDNHNCGTNRNSSIDYNKITKTPVTIEEEANEEE